MGGDAAVAAGGVAACERADWRVWLLASSAASDEEKRRALATGVAVVTLAGRSRSDALAGALIAAASAAAVALVGARVGWRAPDWHFGAAVAFCAIFPLAARLVRRIRFARVRHRFARASVDASWRALAPALTAAWERATPGQRAALMLITKTPA